MALKNNDNWITHYEELRQHVALHGHFPDKHTILCNWVKYQRKRLKKGLMTDEQKMLFKKLEERRSIDHTGGRKKRDHLKLLFIEL